MAVRHLLRPAGLALAWAIATGAAFAAPVMDFVPPAPGSYRLERIQPATDGAVLDTAGRARRLADFVGGGRITLLTFMYGSCADPDGCPYAMAVMHQLKDKLERMQAARQRVDFVSLSFDPQRDTPEVLAHHEMGHGDGNGGIPWHFVTTRSRRELLPILEGYGQDVGVNVDPASGAPTGVYSHVLKVFLIDRRREVREIYTTAYLLPAVVLNDIETLLMEDAAARR
jgi:protein SCO1/2